MPNDNKPTDFVSTPEAVNLDTKKNMFSKFLCWTKNLIKPETEIMLRSTIDEYINTASSGTQSDSVTGHERILLSNILKLRDRTVVSVMIPRADIVAVDIDISSEDLMALLAERQYSRLPVYRGTLDDVLGTIHIKDIASIMAKGEKIDIKSLIREIPVISPAMHILDLLLTMRESRRHMALVVDEFGGIDGLVTVNDVLESIVGEIDDEHDTGQDEKIVTKSDGSVLVDARLTVEEFESHFGHILSNEERNAAETLSGLVYSLEARIPNRGEILKHSTGMIFEVMDADARRINLLKVTHIPQGKA